MNGAYDSAIDRVISSLLAAPKALHHSHQHPTLDIIECSRIILSLMYENMRTASKQCRQAILDLANRSLQVKCVRRAIVFELLDTVAESETDDGTEVAKCLLPSHAHCALLHSEFGPLENTERKTERYPGERRLVECPRDV